MIETILAAIWFFLPAGAGNMMATIANKLPVVKDWEAPMDFGRSWRGQRIFGAHKTWRGFFSGVIFATLTLAVQQVLARNIPALHGLTDLVPGYPSLPVLVLGPLQGAGAMLGDAVKSFFKRRRGKKPGETWLVFDQIDSIVGAEAFSLFVLALPLGLYVAALIAYPLLTVVVTHVGHALHVKDARI